MSKIVFKIPDVESPGYLRRAIAAQEFLQTMNDGQVSPEHYEKLIAFLLNFITEPDNEADKREALLDASEAQFRELMEAVMGKKNPTPPEQSEKN